jgi:hypothetical protein
MSNRAAPRADDGVTAVAAAERALADTAARIRELEAKREAKLAEGGDYVAEVSGIDRDLRTLRDVEGAHRDKLKVLAGQSAKAARALEAQRRIAGIDVIKTRLSPRAAAAAEIDHIYELFVKAVGKLEAADKAIWEDWPPAIMPAQRLKYLSIMNHRVLTSVRREQPMAAGIFQQLVKLGPLNLAAEVEKRNSEFVTELGWTRLPEQAETAA